MPRALCNSPEQKAACQERFLAKLVETANVKMAAQVAGITRRTAYSWKDADPEFAKAWEEHLELAVGALEDEANRRAFQGTKRPVFHQGKVCGHFVEYSDPLAMFLLRAHRPEKYREQLAHVGPGGGPVQVEDMSKLELARQIAFLLAAPTMQQLPAIDVIDAEAA